MSSENPQQTLPRKFMVKFVLKSLCVFALFFVVGCGRWSEERQKADITSGNQIVQALERFRIKTGLYPEDLSALVPYFLPSIVQPKCGNGTWNYSASSERHHFDLSVSDDADKPAHALYYSSQTEKGWVFLPE